MKMNALSGVFPVFAISVSRVHQIGDFDRGDKSLVRGPELLKQ